MNLSSGRRTGWFEKLERGKAITSQWNKKLANTEKGDSSLEFALKA